MKENNDQNSDIKKKKLTPKKKKVAKKKATTKTLNKKPVKKKVVRKKAVKRKTKKVMHPEESFITNVSEKFTSFFDNLIDDVKEIPKKTSDFSKNSQVIETITSTIKKAQVETVQWTKDHMEQLSLNQAIASLESRLVKKHLQLGKQIDSLYAKKKLDIPEIETVIKDISSIKGDISTKQKKLNKLLKAN